METTLPRNVKKAICITPRLIFDHALFLTNIYHYILFTLYHISYLYTVLVILSLSVSDTSTESVKINQRMNIRVIGSLFLLEF